MNDITERRKNFLINFLYACTGLAIYYVFFKYILGVIFPFAVAALVTLILKPAVDWLHRRIGLPRGGISVIVVFIFYAVIGVLLVLLIVRLVTAATDFIAILPQLYAIHMQPAVESVLEWYENTLERINPNLLTSLGDVSANILSSLSQLVTSLSRWAIGFAQGMAVGVPKLLIAVLFGVVSTFFLSMDYPRLRHFILAQFGENGRRIISTGKNFIFKNIGRMLGAYFLIMCITCCELLIFLSIFGVRNALAISVIIAVFDILPAVGTGAIVIPWGIINLINGNIKLGIELLCMYVIVTVVRNVIEPKLVGKTIGVHPVLMLMSIYCGASIFGALGIIIMPFTFMVVKNLNDEGLINIFRSDYYEPDGTKRSILPFKLKKDGKEKHGKD